MRTGRLLVGLVAVIALAGCGPAGPTSVATSAADGWHLVVPADVPAAAMFSDVIATPAGFFVVGLGGQAGEVPVVLHSVDGRSWTAESIESRFGAPARLVAWDDRIIAVGGGEANRCAHPSAFATWVRAPDGTWTEAPFDPIFCAGGGNQTLLVHVGRPFLIGAGTGDVPYLMTTDDGLHWRNHEKAFGDFYPHIAASDGSSLWVFASTAEGHSVALRSADGLRFEPPAGIAGIGPSAGVTSSPVLRGTVVPIVTVGEGAAVLLPDGSGGWRAEAATGLSGDELAGVVAAADRLVAFGIAPDGVPLAWTSVDGTDWSPMRLPDEAISGSSLSGIAAAGGTVVLVGQIPAPDGSTAVGAIWVGSSALLAP